MTTPIRLVLRAGPSKEIVRIWWAVSVCYLDLDMTDADLERYQEER